MRGSPASRSSRTLCPANQLVEPIRLDDFDIVVQKQQQLATSCRRPGVARGGEVKGAIERHDSSVALTLE